MHLAQKQSITGSIHATLQFLKLTHWQCLHGVLWRSPCFAVRYRERSGFGSGLLSDS